MIATILFIISATLIVIAAMIMSLKYPNERIQFSVLFIKYEGPLVGFWPLLFLGAVAIYSIAQLPSLLNLLPDL